MLAILKYVNICLPPSQLATPLHFRPHIPRDLIWNLLEQFKFSQDFAKLFREMFEEANSEFLDHKSAEKFVSFDQINYKRVLETESFKERRIGEFFLTTTYLCDSEI